MIPCTQCRTNASTTTLNMVGDSGCPSLGAQNHGRRGRTGGGPGQEGRHQAALFYADDGMVISLDPAWLQGAFTALVGLFDRVGLRTNFGKTVSMVCHPCHAGAGNRTEEAYGRRITGEGRSYAERQRERVECVECGELPAVGSMSIHLMTRHGKAAG